MNGLGRPTLVVMDPSEQRIGDAERDAAVEALRDHHVAGRLTPEEFDERMAAALSARTRGDLAPLFDDLPADAPAARMSMEKASSAKEVAAGEGRYHRLVEILSAIAWPAALIINFATGWQWWWIIFIPIFLVPALVGEDRGRRRRLERGPGSRQRRGEIGNGDDGDGQEPPRTR
ncbi:hypothetical protein JS278_02682 [Acidipropionibacterium virtanenii]|uniref:DUF1707 domain-containing protein n=2 Tax=Acidipropionibacterium virtanenii TaxID=2057246 RepID=A0A344UX20_9ACTN|nr:hypothetical protein JS278_02682 [Acidipropionibacterium virtanenii]